MGKDSDSEYTLPPIDDPKKKKSENDSDGNPENPERIRELARHKKYDMNWITPNGPKVFWGTQEVLTPVMPPAAKASPSPRVTQLATPKREWKTKEQLCEYMFSCGRESTWNLWARIGKDIPPASGRVNQLASPIPRKVYSRDGDGRGVGSPSPANARVEQLAKARSVPLTFRPNRDLTGEPDIQPNALCGSATDRVTSLAVYPKRKMVPEYASEMGAPIVLSPTPSSRVLELAQPKGIVEGYLHERDVIWDVPRSVQRAICSNRVRELATPNVRQSADHLQFDPNAFKVKETALKGSCPQRVLELSAAIQR